MPKNHNLSVRIRMYRQGLGDCFLLTFAQPGKDDFDMMIDCGLLQGTANAKRIMQDVVKDIEANIQYKNTTEDKGKKRLDVVVLSHEHADHISGFGQAEEIFDRLEFGEVWAGWVDDKNHPKYKAVRERFHKQVAGLMAALSKMKSEQQGLKDTIQEMVDSFFEDEVLGTKGKSDKRSAYEYALKKSVNNPRYCSPGEMITFDGLDDVRIYVLGPSENFESFTKVNPPQGETYRSEGNNFALSDSFFASVADDDQLFDSELYHPFEKHVRIDAKTAARQIQFFNSHYGFDCNKKTDWRRIDSDWLTMAGSLALNLDSYTNNTCLAFAIELVSSKQVLLFPGDAQFANWISWQQLSWEIPGGNGGKEVVTTEALFKQTVLYKVGHHGSHNATLKKHGLEMMSNPNLAAMIPIDREKARSKTSKTNPDGWKMPEKNLFERLKERTRGRVLLADEKDDTPLKSRCQDNKFLRNVKFGGSFIRDASVFPDEEPLYIELTIQG